MLLTSTRSSRARKFTSEDFPTFGRPTIAIAISVSSSLAVTGRAAPPGSIEMTLVEQIADPEPMLGGDPEHRLQTQPMDIICSSLGPRPLDLVDGYDHRDAGLANPLGDVVICRNETVSSAIDQQQDKICRFEGTEPLARDLGVERISARPKQAPGVNEHELRPLPLDWCLEHVAGRTRHRRHDGPAATHESVKQR